MLPYVNAWQLWRAYRLERKIMEKTIRVHSYESMGTFDGPGLRYVVFLQGCPFRCLYCANPDTIDAVGESKETSPDYIYEQAVSMKPFFGKRGGITFSGGEPTVQAEALIPLFERLKAAGVHICVDTNGTVWNSQIGRASCRERVLQVV